MAESRQVRRARERDARRDPKYTRVSLAADIEVGEGENRRTIHVPDFTWEKDMGTRRERRARR